MEQIYKINQLSFNETKSQFCLSYNNGIKAFSTEDFKEKYNSNSMGSVSFAVLVHELNIVVFVGTENNELNNNKKLAIFDLINQKNLYSTPFKNEIKNLKVVNQYLIIGFESELKIFTLEKTDNIMPVKEIALPEFDCIYEIWLKSASEILPLNKMYLIYPFQKELCITSYTGKGMNLDKKYDIKNPAQKAQNIFYIDKLNQFFIPDEKASYIYGIDPYDRKEKLCLYRGNIPGIITSIALMNKNYLAVNNLNKTIHIFDISKNSNNISIGSLIGGFFYGNYINSIMRIKYDDIIKNREGEFYEFDFQKKGAILACNYDEIDLKVIAYNGFAYKIKINFLKKDYEVISKEQFAEFNAEQNEMHSSDGSESKFDDYKSIFDKNNSKNQKNEKFVIYQ